MKTLKRLSAWLLALCIGLMQTGGLAASYYAVGEAPYADLFVRADPVSAYIGADNRVYLTGRTQPISDQEARSVLYADADCVYYVTADNVLRRYAVGSGRGAVISKKASADAVYQPTEKAVYFISSEARPRLCRVTVTDTEAIDAGTFVSLDVLPAQRG